MDDRDYVIMLYDFYGELFNDKQRKYFEEYYFQNFSLGEISSNVGVSRNAIHKVVRGVEDKLKFYEQKLGLFHKNQVICDIIKKVEDSEIKKILGDLVEGDGDCE